MTSRDTNGDAPQDNAGATEPPARRRAMGAEGKPEGGAPVLSLEERKAQRQREREAARAARGGAAGEDGADPAQRARAERRARAAAGEALASDDLAPRRAAALGGVRPGAALGAAAMGVAMLGGAPGAAPLRATPGDAAPAAAALPGTRPAGLARPRGRHWGIALSFLVLVVLPTAVAAWYLWERATPRYASYAGFTVRSEEAASAMEILGGVAALSGGAASGDSDVLYEFIQSQDIVERVDERLDLRALWAKGDPERDPIYAYHPPGAIEDLHDYWQRMVSVYTDGATGLIDIEVQAFTPEDAQAIAIAITEESTTLINRLSDDAQAQATRTAEEELAESVERLKVARAALTRFRNETQIVDPVTAVQSQMGLLSQLESELAQTLIELDLLRQTAPSSDPRIAQAESRVEVIEARMEAERAKLGLGTAGGDGAEEGTAFADLVGQYESLLVDQQFAETSYTASLAARDAAVAESRRQSRYLATHVQPTRAERSDFPARTQLTLLVALFAFLSWAILTLAVYALRDRR